jgi:hypothetical protein
MDDAARQLEAARGAYRRRDWTAARAGFTAPPGPPASWSPPTWTPSATPLELDAAQAAAYAFEHGLATPSRG